jgi:hypothetical protein
MWQILCILSLENYFNITKKLKERMDLQVKIILRIVLDGIPSLEVTKVYACPPTIPFIMQLPPKLI